jgi:acetyl-CoA carboxylase carboxyltransferase component
MAQDEAPGGVYCCVPTIAGLRMLTFSDGSRAGVMGLGEILEAVYREGRQAGAETAEEIVKRLAVRNYIHPSATREYCRAVAGEYEKYVKAREERAKAASGLSVPTPGGGAGAAVHRRKGIFSKVLGLFRRNPARR